MTANTLSLFSTPIRIQMLNLDVKQLSDLFYGIKENNKGRKFTNSGGGWQSDDLNLIELAEKNENFKLLLKHIISVSNEFAKDLGIKHDIGIANLWINISGKGAYNKSHVHPNSILSGVFYIKTPPSCGNIVFANPNINLIHAYLNYFHLLENENLEENSVLKHLDWIIPPEENKILLFPSWLPHYVDDNLSDEDRISISFNFATIYPKEEPTQ